MRAVSSKAKYGIVVLIVISLVLAIEYQAVASGDDFTPIFGQGSHTVWDDEEGEFGNTYSYTAMPTDYGWFTFVSSRSGYSTIAFGCYYTEVSDSTVMSVRFTFNNGMPFSEQLVLLDLTIGEYEMQEVPFIRREGNKIVEALKPSFALYDGFDRIRSSDTFMVEVGPLAFSHDIEDLFEVPASGNLVWCDDRYESE